MTPFAALQALRSRGFDVRVDDGRLIVNGPPARDADGSVRWLNRHWRELRDLVVFDGDVRAVFGARLKEVRSAQPRHCSDCDTESNVLIGFGDGKLCPTCFEALTELIAIGEARRQGTNNPFPAVKSSTIPASPVDSSREVGQQSGPGGHV